MQIVILNHEQTCEGGKCFHNAVNVKNVNSNTVQSRFGQMVVMQTAN